MKLVEIWQYRWFVYFSLIIFALIAEIKGCPKVHAKDIYVDNIAEVYNKDSGGDIAIQHYLNKAKEEGNIIVSQYKKSYKVIVVNGHITIIQMSDKVLIFDSILLADEFLK